MTKTYESYFKSHDQHRLYFKVIDVPQPKAVLIFVHGLNEHVGRYQNPIRFFSSKGYKLYLFDQRGHGKSDGLRSFVDDFSHYLKDLHEFTMHVAREVKGRKIFMVGHSMGGQIVLNYVGQYKTALSGFITSSANIEMVVRISCLKRFLGTHLASLFPRFSIKNEVNPRWISRDKQVVQDYQADPLVSDSMTLKLASEILKNQEKIYELAPKIKLPALIMHAGDDHICGVSGSQKLFKQLVSDDKTLKIYDGFYHELFNDIGKEKVFDDMDQWLKKRCL